MQPLRCAATRRNARSRCALRTRSACHATTVARARCGCSASRVSSRRSEPTSTDACNGSNREPRAFLRMRADALDDGIALEVVSAFRSASYQLGILQRKRERGESIAQILAVSAAPGYSEHHTGRALDLTTPGYPALEQAFEDSPAFAWLMREAGRFRFNLSYPRDNRHGIAYEPWHWCWRSR